MEFFFGRILRTSGVDRGEIGVESLAKLPSSTTETPYPTPIYITVS